MPWSVKLPQLEPADPPCRSLRLRWHWLVGVLDLCPLRWWIFMDKASAEKLKSLLGALSRELLTVGGKPKHWCLFWWLENLIFPASGWAAFFVLSLSLHIVRFSSPCATLLINFFIPPILSLWSPSAFTVTAVFHFSSQILQQLISVTCHTFHMWVYALG